MSLDKRDEMLSHTIEENRKLKELTILYERMMDGSLHPRKRSPVMYTQQSFKNKNHSPLSPNQKSVSPLPAFDISRKRSSCNNKELQIKF